MRAAAARLAMAGLATRSLIQKRVASMLLERIQNSVLQNNPSIELIVEHLCICLRSSHSQSTRDALEALEDSMGEEVPGMSHLL